MPFDNGGRRRGEENPMAIEFAVRIEGEGDGQSGTWVLAVDAAGERFLTTNEDGSFKWLAIADCRLLKVINPDAPRPVMNVQVRQDPVIDLSRIRS
jgi:hypothetical protein